MADRKEYIERGVLLDYLGADKEEDLQPVVVMEFVESIPAADVVEVVRCSQCKHWYQGDCYRLELSRPDDYCSYGERKDGADNEKRN